MTRSMSPVVDGRLGSPCVGICQIDPASGWCGGCGRSEAEMAAWGDWPEPRRREVWDDLPYRMARLGSGFRLLPWTGFPLLQRLTVLARRHQAIWQMGVWGAALQLPATEDGPAADPEGEAIHLRSDVGRMVLRASAAIRAFEVADDAAKSAHIVLALHRVRLKSIHPSRFTRLGPDHEAIDLPSRTFDLFDLGLGQRSMRFCLRTPNPAAGKILQDHDGADPMTMLPLVREIEAQADWIAITPLGRIEITLSGEGRSPADGHVELNGDLLRTGREMPPGVHLPPDYVGCARLRLGQGFSGCLGGSDG